MRSAKSSRCWRRPACRRAASIVHRYHPRRSAPDGGDPAELSEDVGGRRTLRPVAGGSRPLDSRQELYREQALVQSRLRLSAQHGGDGRQSRRTSCSRGPKPRPIPARRTEAFEKYRKGTPTTTHISGSRQGQTQRYRQMISYARQNPEDQPNGTPPPADDHIAPGAAGVGAGVLRDGGNRRRRAGGRRGPPPRQGASQDPDGRHGGRHRGLSYRADAERHHPGDRRPRRHPGRPRPARHACAIPAPASSSSAASTTSRSIANWCAAASATT